MTRSRGEALWPERRKGRWDVVGLGEISLDTVGVFSGPPHFSGKRELESLTRRPGGTIATAVLGCRRLGLEAAFIGAVGTDAEAGEALGPLAEAGVELSGVVSVGAASTRTAFIGVEPGSGDRSVYARRCPELDLDSLKLDPRRIRDARALLIDSSDPDAALWAARLARDEQIPVVLDADSPWPGSERLLDWVDFPVIGEELARHLAGSENPIDGLRILAEAGARLAVATRGEAGCVAVGSGGTLTMPAFPCRVVDTTGAGDAFRAGFLWSLLRGDRPREVLQSASAAGALNCAGVGAQDALPSKPELESFLATPPQP